MKFLKVFIASITILSLLLGCCSCSVEYPEETTIVNGEVQMDPPSDKLLRKIEKDYQKHIRKLYGHRRKYHITDYYGCYNGAIPIKVEAEDSCVFEVEEHEDVAGYRFHYADSGDYIEVWKNGKIFSLKEAHENAIITEDQIGMIYEATLISY